MVEVRRFELSLSMTLEPKINTSSLPESNPNYMNRYIKWTQNGHGNGHKFFSLYRILREGEKDEIQTKLNYI